MELYLVYYHRDNPRDPDDVLDEVIADSPRDAVRKSERNPDERCSDCGSCVWSAIAKSDLEPEE